MVWHNRRKGGNFNLQRRVSVTFIQIGQENRIDKQGIDTRLDIPRACRSNPYKKPTSVHIES